MKATTNLESCSKVSVHKEKTICRNALAWTDESQFKKPLHKDSNDKHIWLI